MKNLKPLWHDLRLLFRRFTALAQIQSARGGLRFVLVLLTFGGAVGSQAQYSFATNSDGTLTIAEYLGPGGDVIIPTTTNGRTITSIGDGSFSGWPLTSIAIPDSVTSIGNDAFWGCTSLTSVTLPAGVTNFGGNVFLQCTGLTNAIFADGATLIGPLAFQSCTNLRSVTIPNSVTRIENTAFYNCKGLKNVTLPAGLVTMEDNVFWNCTGLTNVTLAVGAACLGDSTFQDCSNLTRVTIPSTVTNIGTYAFLNCTSLASITVPGSEVALVEGVFYNCTNLARVYFTGNAPTLGLDVFYPETNVTAYYLPGTAGWSNTFAGFPALPWNAFPQAVGVVNGLFEIHVSGTAGIPIMIEACSNLAMPVWTPLQAAALTNGAFVFGDANWANYPARCYRISSY